MKREIIKVSSLEREFWLLRTYVYNSVGTWNWQGGVSDQNLMSACSLIRSRPDLVEFDEKLELLCASLKGGLLPIVQVLLRNKAYVAKLGFKKANGLTALHIAVAASTIECIGALVQTIQRSFEKPGKIINAKDLFGNTPLHLACYRKKILELDLYPMVRTPGPFGQSGASEKESERLLAACTGDIQRIIDLLLRAKANPGVTNEVGQVPESFAMEQAVRVAEEIQGRGRDRGTRTLADREVCYWPSCYRRVIGSEQLSEPVEVQRKKRSPRSDSGLKLAPEE